jgi:hypothetical protein
MSIQSDVSYILDNLSHIIGADGITLDNVAYFEVAEVVSVIKESTKLEPSDSSFESPEKAFGSLLLWLGMWYGWGTDGQKALDSAAALLKFFKTPDIDSIKLWKE